MKHGNGGWIALGVVLLGISVASWVIRPAPRVTTPPATPAAAPPPPAEPRRSDADLLRVVRHVGQLPDGENATYFWRSEREAVLLRPAPKAPAHFRLTVLNTQSGKEQPLRSFNEAFGGLLRGHRTQVTVAGRPGAELTYEAPVAALSPEGRSLLWFGGRLFWHAATLEGEATGRWRQPSPLRNQAVWLRDGQRWAEVETDLREGLFYLRRVHLHDLRSPQADRTVETPALEDGFALGFTPEEKLLVRHGSAAEARETPEVEAVSLTQVDLSDEQGQLDRYPLRLPDPSRVVECALSPAGDRLAWILEPRAPSAGPPPRFELWTSGLRGETMVQVGSTSGKKGEPAGASWTDESHGPRDLRWLPGGKQVSFRLRDDLYLAPAE